MGTTVAISDPLPIFRGGLHAALTMASFMVCEPADIVEWTGRSPSGRGGPSSTDTAERAVLLSLATQTDWTVLDRLHDRRPDMPIVTLLEQPSDASYREALTRGALSAAPRGAACEHIVDVVRAAVEGRTLLPAKVSRALARSMATSNGGMLQDDERSWLRALGEGASVENLARRFGYSRRTMYRRLNSIYRRLGADGRESALLTAVRAGLI